GVPRLRRVDCGSPPRLSCGPCRSADCLALRLAVRILTRGERSNMFSAPRVGLAFVCAIAMASAVRLHTVAQPSAPDSSLYSGLRWRMLGPFRGGRFDAVSGVPGRPHEFYFGSVNGGVWKTVNAGRTWMPIFDSQ